MSAERRLTIWNSEDADASIDDENERNNDVKEKWWRLFTLQ